ncbi:hypothetical protein [Rickettsia endosymbiont of Orchestes rusci]|uniref:hypothetical protein n=1 Tax=Rickettsia endosymbiont of Orchestes rusci TaxID=3066250 RepID=UPI00313B6FE0
MKWQAIANVTGQINEEAKGYLVRKLEKDASAEVPHLWADFITETSGHLHNSQSNIEISPSGKTGGFAVVTKFDELHPDHLESGKQFINYALDKYDQRAVGYLANVKNPFTRRSLQSKIGDYRIHLTNQINHTEIKLIDGKRHHMAIESIEKSKNAIYNNPEFYGSFLQDSFTAINLLSLPLPEKEQLIDQAQSALAAAAASSMLKRSPEALINQSRLPPEAQPLWLQHLNLDQKIKLDNNVSNLLKQKQAIKQQQVKSVLPSHYASILKTGSGVTGFENLLNSSFAPNDPNLLKIKRDEALYKQASEVAEQLKKAPLSEGNKILAEIAPKGGEIDYLDRERMHHILVQNHHDGLKTALSDPAKYIEELFSEEMPQSSSLAERCVVRKQYQQQKGIPEYAQRCLTNDEQAEFLRRIEGGGNNINQVKNTIDSIIGLKDENGNNYGLTIMEEIFSGKDSELFISLYADNRLYNRNIADIFLKMIPYKGQLFNAGEEREYNKFIAENKTLQEWQSNIFRQGEQNTNEISERKQEIKYLALHYVRNGQLKPKEAIEKATEIVIKQRYMSVTKDKLQIPQQLITNNMIHNLDEDYIEANLAERHSNIINGNINYDYHINFGANWQDGQSLIVKALQQGQWKLTPDGKSAYFTFLTEEGTYQPLMEKEGKILTFDLIDLNNPQGLERQKREFEQMSLEIYNKFGQ